MARIKGKIRPPYLIAVGGFVFQLIMLAELPQLSLVVMSTILCAVLIFFTWCVKKNFPLPAKIITTGSLLFFTYFPVLLSRKMWILFCVLWFVILVVIEQIFRHVVYKQKMKTDILLAQLLYLICWLGAAVNTYGYGKNTYVPFWQVSLVVALMFGLLQAVLAEQTEQDVKKNITKKLSVFLIYGLLSFFVVSAGVQNLNYALDVSEPTRYSAVIEAKRSHHSRKGRDYRYFRFTVNGETIELDVPASTYRTYNVGDTYNITQYQGAFGVPYYMAGRN